MVKPLMIAYTSDDKERVVNYVKLVNPEVTINRVINWQGINKPDSYCYIIMSDNMMYVSSLSYTYDYLIHTAEDYNYDILFIRDVIDDFNERVLEW